MYVQLDADYYDHPKTLHLISLIGPEADAYPPRLWTWALKYAKSGVLRSNAMIEVACRWRGEPGKLAAALMASGFVDMDGLTIHGWMERTGHDIVRYEEKKTRLRARYRHSSGILPEDSGKIPAESGKNSGRFRESSAVSERNGTELNGTERNGGEGESTTPLPGTPRGLLWKKFLAAHITGTDAQKKQYFEAWYAQVGADRLEQILMDPKVKGVDVFAVQRWFFNDILANSRRTT